MKYTEINTRPYEIHSLVVNHVPCGAKVLDLGCAAGYMARELKKKRCIVTGVDVDKMALKEAKKYCERVLQCDLQTPNVLIKLHQKYDVILLLDVIEHLFDAKPLLIICKALLAKNGILIVSTPNFAHISIRLSLLFGSFVYTETGLLDKLHVHFYTKSSLKCEIEQAGYVLHGTIPSSDFGQIPLLGVVLRHIPKIFQYFTTKLFPTVLAPQFLVIAKVA